jgi:hypothetical protein
VRAKTRIMKSVAIVNKRHAFRLFAAIGFPFVILRKQSRNARLSQSKDLRFGLSPITFNHQD